MSADYANHCFNINNARFGPISTRAPNSNLVSSFGDRSLLGCGLATAQTYNSAQGTQNIMAPGHKNRTVTKNNKAVSLAGRSTIAALDKNWITLLIGGKR